MQAFHEAGKVVIKISDDGTGIDPQRVKLKAIQAGLISPDRADLMSERSLLNLIFMPGFSTSDQITQFSGRGVGMNVVRTNIERIGGTVDIESRLGRGTALNIKIPLTLAIIPALIVLSAGRCFAIPQIGLVELIRIEADRVPSAIHHIRGTPLYRLRGKLLPLVALDEQLQLRPASPPDSEVRAVNFVVLQADDRQFGLIVDDIHEIGDIVVKPFQRYLKGIKVFAGATMLGDGRIALILDILGLAKQSRIISNLRARVVDEQASFDVGEVGELMTLVVCGGPDNRRLAMPLSQVVRLEEFPCSALEWAGRNVVVQYRGEIMPIVDVFDVTGAASVHYSGLIQRMQNQSKSNDPNDFIQVIVHEVNGRNVGLFIGEILDIVEDTLVNTEERSQAAGNLSAVIQGRVTEIIDADAIMRSVGFVRQNAESAFAVEA